MYVSGRALLGLGSTRKKVKVKENVPGSLEQEWKLWGSREVYKPSEAPLFALNSVVLRGGWAIHRDQPGA